KKISQIYPQGISNFIWEHQVVIGILSNHLLQLGHINVICSDLEVSNINTILQHCQIHLKNISDALEELFYIRQSHHLYCKAEVDIYNQINELMELICDQVDSNQELIS